LEENKKKTVIKEHEIVFKFDVIKRFSIIFFAKTIGDIFFFIVNNILIVNWLSIESNRDYILFSYLVNLFFTLILSLHIAIPKFLQKDSTKSRKDYLINAVFLLMINLIIIAVFLIVLTLGFNYDYNASWPNFEFLIIFLLGGLGYEFFRFFQSVFYGLKLAKKVAIINLFLSVFFLIISFIMLVNLELGFIGAVSSYIISFFLIDILSFYLIFRGFERKKNHVQKNLKSKTINLAIQKELIIFSLPILISNIFYYLNTRYNALLVSGLGGNFSLILGLSLSLTIYLIGLLGVTINDLLFPYESNAFYHNDQEKIKEIFKLLRTFVVTVIIPMLLICIIVSEIILTILYPTILAENPIFIIIFQLVLLGGIFYSLNQFTAKFLVAKGLTIKFLIIQIIGASINILFALLTMPFIGIYSATWGFIISMGVMFILYFYYLSKIVELSLREFKLIQLVFSILVVIIEFSTLKIIFDLNDYLIGILCLLSYFILLFGFRILKIKDLKKFLKELRIIIFKNKRV